MMLYLVSTLDNTLHDELLRTLAPLNLQNGSRSITENCIARSVPKDSNGLKRECASEEAQMC
jgi:hypothetical protein